MKVAVTQSRSTGKERDSESGLDYFGARYYGSTMGRFTSPDPLLNSGRPWDPQSWNRYSYVSNNPLQRIDPDGMYDFAVTCAKKDSACQKKQTRFNDAVDRARKIAAKLPAKSKERLAINKSLSALGTKGDGNGVSVKFGPTETGAPMDTQGKTISVDWGRQDAAVENLQKQGLDLDSAYDDTFSVLHEGIHTTQDTRDLTPNIWNRWDILAVYEGEAYRTESYAAEAAGKNAATQVWNVSWANAGDKDKIRERAIRDAAWESVDLSRKEYSGRPK